MPPKKKVRRAKTWQQVAEEAQRHRDGTLTAFSHCLKLEELEQAKAASSNATQLPAQMPSVEEATLEITALSPKSLAKKIALGVHTASDVVSAFSTTAAIAQKAVNCLTELLPSRATTRAAELDRHIAATGKPVGPLHGLPISVKSHIGIAGCQVAAGYIAWYDDPTHVAARDALVVQCLERAGGVVHARTTEPQSMMQLECASNLYGRTLNPYNLNLSSGGSSGGEAALLAMRGSVIGVGSDVGGSIRVPAAACGVFGLKPTAFRVPTTGWSSTPPGADPIPTVLGPMSCSLEGIDMFMDVVLASEPWKVEPALVPLPWRTVDIVPSPTRPLRIGVAVDDGVVVPHPPIVRVLEELSKKMAALAHVEVVKFPLYKLDEAWAIGSSLYFTDGGEADIAVMNRSGEPMLPLVHWILKENPAVKKLTREKLEYWLEEREEYRIEYAEHWNRTGRLDEATGSWVDTVDALICPVAPGVATRHDTAKYWTYSAVWNLLDYPALAFPAGTADKERDVQTGRADFKSFHDRKNWELCE
jgi:Asp-tRNA(Asn)/Glu-tRNA(Gln) amidotransferase A subunit family amidase